MGREAVSAPRLSFRRCLLLYAGLTGLCLVVHNRLVDSVALDARRALHERVLRNEAPAPLQYRVMTFYLAEAARRAGRALGFDDPFRAAYLLVRGLFTFLAALLLHRFLSAYLPLPFVLAGVFLTFAWLPLTYINYYMQETDPANMVFFLIGYDLIRRRRDGALAALLPLAMLNRETPVMLALVWLLYRWDEMPLARTALRFLGLSGAALGAYFALRVLFGHHTAYAEFNDFFLNLRSVNSYLYFLLLFGALAAPALKGLGAKSKFLRRAALFLPFFLVFHFVIPIFQETRLFLPIFPLVIALAFTSFVEPSPEALRAEERPAASPWASRGRTLYVVFLAAFLGATALYLAYLEKTHVEGLRGKQKAERHVRAGHEAHAQKNHALAAREWEWGLLYDPDDYDVHFNLAVVYSEYLFDVDRAWKHWRECERLAPDDPKLKDLKQRIEDIQRRRERFEF